jgi:SpoVK/Ycf46/Vps4 family AAA+-type ATPase
VRDELGQPARLGFLRPGRFDYVLPVGPPDAEARRAIWGRYVDEITDLGFELDSLVAASELSRRPTSSSPCARPRNARLSASTSTAPRSVPPRRTS